MKAKSTKLLATGVAALFVGVVVGGSSSSSINSFNSLDYPSNTPPDTTYKYHTTDATTISYQYKNSTWNSTVVEYDSVYLITFKNGVQIALDEETTFLNITGTQLLLSNTGFDTTVTGTDLETHTYSQEATLDYYTNQPLIWSATDGWYDATNVVVYISYGEPTSTL